jgi:hypothetical protein
MEKKIDKIIICYEDGTYQEMWNKEHYKMPPPVFPYSAPIQPAAPFVPTYTSCVKCGMNLETVMSYTCMQEKCPSGFGPAWCSTTDRL